MINLINECINKKNQEINKNDKYWIISNNK